MSYTPVPSKVDDAAFTPATDRVSPIGCVFDDVATDSVDEGDIGCPRMSANRILYATLKTPNGDSAMDETNDAVRVNLVTSSSMTGSEYTEGDTDASITGTAILWEDTGDTLRPVSAAKPLPISDAGGSLTVDATSLPLPTGAATETTLTGVLTTSDFDSKVGSLTETAPATDTASSGLNGRLQRIAQRLTSLIALVPAALTGSGNFKVSLAESTASQAVTNANLDAGLSTLLTTSDFDTKAGSLTETAPATDTASSGLNGRLQRIAQRITSLIAVAATETTLSGVLTTSDFDSKTGSLTETAPATDTASSGLNGRLQRIAQRLTSLITLFPTALGGTTAANSFAVTLATDGQFVTSTGSVTETAPTTDTASSGLNGRLQRIAQRITSLIALLPAALVSGRLDVNLGAAPATVTANATLQAGTANAANVGGITTTVSATLTRPANTTAYTAGDEMTDTGGAILTLTSIASASGKAGIITHVAVSVSTNASTKPDLTLFFYDTTSTPQTDNAAFAPSDAVQDTFIGYCRLTDFQVGDATSNTGNFTMDSGPIHIPFNASGSANLFLRVKVNNAYTAGANSDTYKFRVKAQDDL